MREFLIIFATVFVAELGDKTQLATLGFAAENKTSAFLVFAAAAGALVLGTAISVAFGTLANRYLSGVPLRLIAGIGFVAIGAWTIVQYYRGA
ncbi:MAG TPA: TMEM165/GDT1 family protein [Rhizomicrobium sp.]